MIGPKVVFPLVSRTRGKVRVSPARPSASMSVYVHICPRLSGRRCWPRGSQDAPQATRRPHANKIRRRDVAAAARQEDMISTNNRRSSYQLGTTSAQTRRLALSAVIELSDSGGGIADMFVCSTCLAPGWQACVNVGQRRTSR
jgi:hypothetical protein